MCLVLIDFIIICPAFLQLLGLCSVSRAAIVLDAMVRMQMEVVVAGSNSTGIIPAFACMVC
jgi:hypothetical protein